jgi:hypothetical protein
MREVLKVIGNKDIEHMTEKILTAITKPKEVLEIMHQMAGVTFVQSVESPALVMVVPRLLRGLRVKTVKYDKQAWLQSSLHFAAQSLATFASDLVAAFSAIFVIILVSFRPSNIFIQARMTRKKPSSFVWKYAALFALFSGHFNILAYEYGEDNQNVAKKGLMGMKVK